MHQEPQPVNVTKRKRQKPAFRNRRRANRLPAMELRAIQTDFELIRRNSEDVGRDHLLPRAEVVDAVLIGLGVRTQFLSDQIHFIRKQMGIAVASTQGPFLLDPGGKPVRSLVEKSIEKRKAS